MLDSRFLLAGMSIFHFNHLRFWNLNVVVVMEWVSKIWVIEILNIIFISLVFVDQRFVQLSAFLWVGIWGLSDRNNATVWCKLDWSSTVVQKIFTLPNWCWMVWLSHFSFSRISLFIELNKFTQSILEFLSSFKIHISVVLSSNLCCKMLFLNCIIWNVILGWDYWHFVGILISSWHLIIFLIWGFNIVSCLEQVHR